MMEEKPKQYSKDDPRHPDYFKNSKKSDEEWEKEY